MHYIFLITNGLWKSSYVIITWSGIGIGNGIGVAGCSWWGDGTCCGIWWGWVWLGWAGARGGTRHIWHKPISITINHKFTRPSAISTLGDFSISQNGQPAILAQPNFHTLNKSGQCSPKHRQFSDFWCHMIDETFSHPNMKISKMFHIFYLADYSKVSTFFLRHSV